MDSLSIQPAFLTWYFARPMIGNAPTMMENAQNHTVSQERLVLSFSRGIVAVVVMRHIYIAETHARRHCGNPHESDRTEPARAPRSIAGRLIGELPIDPRATV